MSGGHGGGHDTHDDDHHDASGGPTVATAQIISAFDTDNLARMRYQVAFALGRLIIIAVAVVVTLSLSYYVVGGLFRAIAIPIELVSTQIDKIKAGRLGADMLLDFGLLLLELAFFVLGPRFVLKLVRLIVNRNKE